MEATYYYAAGLGSLCLILMSFKNLPHRLFSHSALTSDTCRRLRSLPGFTNITWLDASFVIIHLAGNVAFLAAKSTSLTQFSRYSGTLSLINALPLSLSSRSGLLGAKTRIGICVDVVLHRYLGTMVFLEALAHVITIATTRRVAFHTRVDVTGLAVGKTPRVETGAYIQLRAAAPCFC